MKRSALVLLALSCKGGDAKLTFDAAASSAPVVAPPVTVPPTPAIVQPELALSDAGPNDPPSRWMVSYAVSSTFSKMSYAWSVAPNNSGEMHASQGLDPKRPARRDVKFHPSDASLRELAASLQKDDCCATWRASTCRVPDAPPADISFELGGLRCTAHATPECTEDARMHRCFQHLDAFVHAACGAACE